MKAIRLGQTLHGYQFSSEKVEFMKKKIIKKGSHDNKIKVGRYNDSGELLETYSSILDCIKSGYTNVTRALKSNKKHKGFFFKKIQD